MSSAERLSAPRIIAWEVTRSCKLTRAHCRAGGAGRPLLILTGGCRARAYAATGNYLAEEPCCHARPKSAPGRM